MQNPASIGIIGGSGLSDLPEFTLQQAAELDTPYGLPSDTIQVGEWAGRTVAFVPRHGRGHHLLPSEVPNRANIYALKALGVERVIAISAVGSMQLHIRPLDIVLPHQFIDNTHQRISTFFGNGLAGHVNVTQPTCPTLRAALHSACQAIAIRVHAGGIYQCEEGPQFPTQAEAELYRARSNVSIIGMTLAPEMKLAREAELCYAAICLVTDYAPWNDGTPLSTEVVVANARKMREIVRRILNYAMPRTPVERECHCRHALNGAIQTDAQAISLEVRQRLGWLIGDLQA